MFIRQLASGDDCGGDCGCIRAKRALGIGGNNKSKVSRLTTEEIIAYVETGESMDKAGAYGIQGYGALLVEKIEGCYFNVVGLPLQKVAAGLRNWGLIFMSTNIVYRMKEYPEYARPRERMEIAGR